MTEIVFGAETNLTESQQRQIKTWPALARAIEENGNQAAKLFVQGASFIEPEGVPTVLFVNARIEGKNADGSDISRDVLVTADDTVKLPNITFDERTKFNPSESDKELILGWAPLLRAIKDRKEDFQTADVIIKGAAFKGDKKELLLVMAQVVYKNPNGSKAKYNVIFGGDAASLTVGFRVSAHETTSWNDDEDTLDLKLAQRVAKVLNKYTHKILGLFEKPDWYILAIREPRWGPGETHTLQVPAGLLDANEMIDLESVRRGAAREFFEETLPKVAPRLAAFFNDKKEYEGMCESPFITLAPAMREDHHPFGLAARMSTKEFEALKADMEGKGAGKEREEGESMKVTLLPLEKMISQLQKGRGAPWVSHIMVGFISLYGLWGYMDKRAEKPTRALVAKPAPKRVLAA